MKLHDDITKVHSQSNPSPDELLGLYEKVLRKIASECVDFDTKNLALAALGDKAALRKTEKTVPMPADRIKKDDPT